MRTIIKNLRIDTQNLWAVWKYSWRTIDINVNILGLNLFGILLGQEWLVLTLFNFRVNIEWFEVFLDRNGEEWPFQIEEVNN